MTPAAEFNIWADPEAAAERLPQRARRDDGRPRRHAPGAADDADWPERFRAAGRIGAFVAELVDFFKRYHARDVRLGRRADPRRGRASRRSSSPACSRPSAGTSRSSSSPSSAAAGPSSTSGAAPSASRTRDVAVGHRRTTPSSSSCSSGSRSDRLIAPGLAPGRRSRPSARRLAAGRRRARLRATSSSGSVLRPRRRCAAPLERPAGRSGRVAPGEHRNQRRERRDDAERGPQPDRLGDEADRGRPDEERA